MAETIQESEQGIRNDRFKKKSELRDMNMQYRERVKESLKEAKQETVWGDGRQKVTKLNPRLLDLHILYDEILWVGCADYQM